ncbi:hypothetical protein [Sulfurimonas sp.]|uniref:hypothetical protein n=1 Tax=Sulfurimonas sp. TaxID=2022749 RepID=UPI002AB0107D|nr:hypothetical protein [Sulfurimonas sp.]
MQVSSQTNNFAAMNAYQQPVQQIAPKPEPTHSNEDIYKASNGNLVAGKDGGVALTPQGELNVANKQEEKATQASDEEQATKDAQRGVATDYLGTQSKKSQVEIYLAVTSDSKVSLGENDTASIIETLRDVQKQNNAVQAYSTYQENQKGGHPALF